MNNKLIENLVIASMFLAIGLVLPLLTGQIPAIGKMLLPMHIPVFLCGLICGWKYGGGIGFILPIMRHVIFGVPILYPTAIAMTFEMAVCGLTVGFLYGRSKWKCIMALYRSILIAMICGRVVWGCMQVVLLGVGGEAFTWSAFISGAIINAVPGIIIQLILIPPIMIVLHKTGLVRFKKRNNAK